MLKAGLCFLFVSVTLITSAQKKAYPQGYFRNPLNIKMELVANFGELRTNHWHMGLDIRTQQRENLPVHAAAEGYIARIKIEPGGFGRAIYINHPNGYTTLYAHLNAFMPAIESWLKAQQYEKESWAGEFHLPPNLINVAKGQFFAYSGNTGASAGPHVHFEIRDTKTDNCLNPLLFGFPIPDAVPPAISRLAMYDRTRSVYTQSPQGIGLKKTGGTYVPAIANLIKVGAKKISFAIGAVDRFTGTPNPNGIYSTRTLLDGKVVSEFVLDDINYGETRYMNAQIDYRYKYAGGGWLQHLSPMTGDVSKVYTTATPEGVIALEDNEVHAIKIEVRDAAQNISVIQFSVQYSDALAKAQVGTADESLIPNYVNVVEQNGFEAYTTERTVYDTVPVLFKMSEGTSPQAASSLFTFIGPSIPAHDSVTVTIKPEVDASLKDKIVIQNISGTKKFLQKGDWNGDWVWAKFRQFGTYQALVDNVPPSVSAPPLNLTRSTRLVFTPTDNLNVIKRFRAEVDGRWLRFSNQGGRTWVYVFDEKFPAGTHDLKITVEDEAGNVTSRTWRVTR